MSIDILWFEHFIPRPSLQFFQVTLPCIQKYYESLQMAVKCIKSFDILFQNDWGEIVDPFHHTETSRTICSTNQMAGFYIMETLVVNKVISKPPDSQKEKLSHCKDRQKIQTEMFLFILNWIFHSLKTLNKLLTNSWSGSSYRKLNFLSNSSSFSSSSSS